jgi:hypothetical protein
MRDITARSIVPIALTVRACNAAVSETIRGPEGHEDAAEM